MLSQSSIRILAITTNTLWHYNFGSVDLVLASHKLENPVYIIIKLLLFGNTIRKLVVFMLSVELTSQEMSVRQ